MRRELDIDVSYRPALALAREELAAALAKRDAAEAELQATEDRMRKLRSVIYALSNQLGEPMPDLPEIPVRKPARAIRSSAKSKP